MVRKTPILALALGAALVLAQAARAQFVFTLSGGQEVPPVGTAATGSCTAILAEEELIVACSHDVEGAVGAYIHAGDPGENGPISVAFPDSNAELLVATLSLDLLAHLYTESLYVNIHSVEHPAGEIRGQIRFQGGPRGAHATFLPLAGSQVVPPVAAAARGRCLVVGQEAVATDPAFMFLVCHHSVGDPVVAHIHRGDAGSNGPIVLDLGAADSPIVFDGDPGIPDFVEELLAGNLYVQVHSVDHPNGELRGQVDGCFTSPTSLCLNDNRFQAQLDWRTEIGTEGKGRGVRETGDSGMIWFFSPDNLEILVKVLDACSFSDFYWVFFAPTTNVEFTLTVTDTARGLTKSYRNELGQAAQPVLDTAAFACAP